MPKFSERVKERTKPEPLWKGPEVEGVTQSMLGAFLVCRERFRVRFIEGLEPADDFNHRIEYGQMWHVCEEHKTTDCQTRESFDSLKEYCKQLCQRYPMRQTEIEHWYNVCKVQFPIYVDYWQEHEETIDRKPLLAEQTFTVPYTLPSGRMVKLRGKWDGVSLLKNGIYLDEHKTKGDIDEAMLQKQLTFDLQTMFYTVTLMEWDGGGVAPHEMLPFFTRKWPFRGVRYNVIRRPLSGGKGSIRKHQAKGSTPEETDEHFYTRLAAIIMEDPGYFFMRWQVEVTPDEIERFKQQFLNPVLEQLCDWYEWVMCDGSVWGGNHSRSNDEHFRMPYGVYSPLLDGKTTEYDEYLATGSLGSLRRADKLFKELQ